jgi:muramidase (phage lysozyme)
MHRLAKAEPLLRLIRKHESDPAVKPQGVPSAYDVVFGGIRVVDRPKALSKLTVERVLWWQDLIDPLYLSEAAGAYQIMEDTLRGLMKSGHVKGSEVFDKECQDRLALILLDRRGWEDAENGLLSPVAFGNELAKEWASLPMLSGPKKGQSYYGGINKALATVPEVIAAIREALELSPGNEDAVVAWLKTAPKGIKEVGSWLSRIPEGIS